MTGQPPTSRGRLFVGLVLILIGGGILVARVSGVEIGWPAWIIIPGLVLILAALVVGGPGGTALAVLGGLATMTGVVLAVQETYGLYATWVYAWALVAPGGVGLGLATYGLLARRGHDLRSGLWALFSGLVIFLVGFLFFEGALHISGRRFADLTDVVAPAILVGLGAVTIAAALVPGPWRRPDATRHEHGRGMRRRGAAEPGDAEAASAGASGAEAGWSRSAPDQAAPDQLAIPLEGASDAEVMLTFGAGRLAIGPAAPGMLLDGTYDGGVTVEQAAPGRVRISPPAPARLGLDRPPYTWQVGLSPDVPLRLRVESGAADAELDLAGLRLEELRLRTGASETRVTLPAAAGLTRVDAEGGAASIRFRVPDGVAASIRSTIALGSTDVDVARFPRRPDGSGWESPDFASAPNRVEIAIRGGVGSVSVR